MAGILRQYSLFIRRWRAAKERRRILADFNAWSALQGALPPPAPFHNRLLIVRLDDIGDYLLFRNQLGAYRESERWKDHTITLLGNAAWREIFDAHDRENVDEVIWVNKRDYLLDANYRLGIWTRLRAGGFATVIAPSRTRPLLLDDLCVSAAAPALCIGSTNSYVHADWNRTSDRMYQQLFRPRLFTHEFQFNAEFATWACGRCFEGSRPTIHSRLPSPSRGSYILCFVGANTRSKRWPSKRWIDFIARYRRDCSDEAVVAGAAATEIAMARLIEEKTGAFNIAGRVSLLELLAWVAGARAVITNDTMAAHLGASCNRPTLIVANGVNYSRFTDYEVAGIPGVGTVYPRRFNRRRQRLGNIECRYEDVVTADIVSINAQTVLEELKRVLLRSP